MEITKQEQHTEVIIKESEISLDLILQMRKEVGDSVNCIVVFNSEVNFNADAAGEFIQWAKSVGTDKSFKVCGIEHSAHEKQLGEEVDWVPTMTEARDLIFMEEVERDLNLD